MKPLVATLLVAALVGSSSCAARYQEPVLGPAHPASPDAAAAPPPPRLSAFASSPAPAAEPAAPHAPHHGHHGHHGHDLNDQPAPGAPVYACPMHPHVTSDTPEARCPECGMKLTKRVEGTEP